MRPRVDLTLTRLAPIPPRPPHIITAPQQGRYHGRQGPCARLTLRATRCAACCCCSGPEPRGSPSWAPLDSPRPPTTLPNPTDHQVLRVGVIGVGRIGRVHIESIQSIKDATVVMVRAPRPQRVCFSTRCTCVRKRVKCSARKGP